MPAQQGFPAPVEIEVDRTELIPTIAVHVGQAQLGTYDIILWTRRGKPFRIGSGSTMDDAPDVHRIVRTRKQLQQIDGFTITVVVVVQAVSRRAGARWSCDVDVFQGDAALDRFHEGGAVNAALLTVRRAYEVRLV